MRLRARYLIALLLFAPLLTSACDEYRFDTRPKDYNLNGHIFSIPNTYLGFIPDDSSGMVDHLKLSIHMPEFEPRTRENAKDDNAELITIHIWPASGNLLKISNEDYIQTQLKTRMGSEVATWEKPRRLDNGLVLYSASGGKGWLTDFYLMNKKGQKPFLLECSSDQGASKPPNPLCVSRSIYKKDLKVTYWYQKRYFPDAIDIHKKIELLLEDLHKEKL